MRLLQEGLAAIEHGADPEPKLARLARPLRDVSSGLDAMRDYVADGDGANAKAGAVSETRVVAAPRAPEASAAPSPEAGAPSVG